MTKLNKTNVKETLAKLDLETILRLLLLCRKDYQLFSGNDVSSPRKELSIHCQALIDYIVDPNNEDNEEIYEKAKAIAESLAKHDREIQTIKGEIKPLQDELKVKKDRLKQSNDDRNKLIEGQTNELDKILDDVALNKLAQYHAVVENVATREKNKKQINKALKEVGKGFIASNIAGVTEEFGEAICEVNKVTFGFFNKLRSQIRQQKEAEINFDTVAGLDRVNQKFDLEWLTHKTNIINQTGLNSDWRQAEEVPAQKLLMPAEGEAIAA